MQRIYRALGIASAQDVLDLRAANESLQRTARSMQKAMESIMDPGRIADDVRDSIDIDALADDVASAARDNFDISDCMDVYDLAQEVRDNIDVDALAQEVKDNIDIDALVADSIGDAADLDKLVNRVIEREAPGIIGAHLKHLDWDDELSVDVEIDGAIIATVRSNR